MRQPLPAIPYRIASRGDRGPATGLKEPRMELEIYNDIEHNRFVVQTEHGEATLKYKRADADTLDYTSTFVPEEARNGGLGERLVLHALDWAAENDFQVIPT